MLKRAQERTAGRKVPQGVRLEAGSQAPAADFFRSVDSAPAGISVRRPRQVQDLALVSFAFISVLALGLPEMLRHAGLADLPRDFIAFTADRANAVLPVRTFFAAFFLTYAAYAFAGFGGKLKLGFLLLAKFAVAGALVDGGAWLSWRYADAAWPIHLQQFLVGMAGLAIFPHTILAHARLPADSGTPVRNAGKLYQYALILAASLIAGACAIVMATVYEPEADYLRSIALLGGMGPGVFLAQQIFTGQLATLGWVRNLVSRRRKFSPPVAVLIPAHNEAHQIRETLLAVDRAAADYPGKVRVIVAENRSEDDTAKLAETTLKQCENIAGYTVDSSQIPGKARALNRGLDQVWEDFVIRIDADTMVGERAIRTAMRHFANAHVGAVGGLPMPHEEEGLLSKVRAIEVLLRHGFVQVAYGALGGVFGLPGMFVIYRMEAIDKVGGFVEGMNGEDTDITLRIANLGYRNVSDPAVKFKTETPDTLAFLREQRTRWFRSLYHVVAHNRSSLFVNGSVIGAVMLPFTLLNGARRAMMTPLLIYGLVTFFVFGGIYAHPDFATLVALVLGMPFVLAITVLIVWRRFDLMVHMPLYMGFRFLRSYYTLGSVLSLVYPRDGDKLFAAETPKRAPPDAPEREEAPPPPPATSRESGKTARKEPERQSS